MTKSFGLRSLGARARQRPLVTMLVVSAAILVPGAVAWACVPSAAIGFDSPSYSYGPNDTVRVRGRQWPARTGVTLTVAPQPGGVNGAIRAETDSIGHFEAAFTMSGAAPGNYNVTAQSDANSLDGTPQAKRMAREAFEVRAQAVAPAPSGPTGRRARARRNCNARYRRDRRRVSRRTAVRRKRACLRRANRLPA